MNSTRNEAHLALRELWEIADHTLRCADTEAIVVTENAQTRELGRAVETPNGALVERIGDIMLVSAEYELLNGGEETVVIQFAEDMRDLADSNIRVEWSLDGRQGVNTPPLRKIPEISATLLKLF